MNRGDYILQELNAKVDDESTFNVVALSKDNAQNSGTKTNVYLYIIKELVTEQNENDSAQFLDIDIGVKISRTLTSGGAAWRNDCMHKLEKSLQGFGQKSTTQNNVAITLYNVFVSEQGGYFDDGRTNADCYAMISLKAVQKES